MIQNHDRMEGHPKPGELKRKKAGQKKCNNCHKIWNNAATPNGVTTLERLFTLEKRKR